jgi:hypothetical protein
MVAKLGETLFSQIIVVMVGSLAPMVIEWLKHRQRAGSPAAAAGRAEERTRSLLDLAILLIYSAFLSAILSHSMIISGRTPSFDGSVLGTVAIVTVGTALVLYLAWRRGIGELAAGAMSFAALIVLLIAPGSALSTTAPEGREPGLPLPLPVLALTFATAAAVIYVFGNPLAPEMTPTRRRRVTFGLITLALATALILGYAFLNGTIHDPEERTPRFKGTDAQAQAAEVVLKDLRKLDLTQRGLFYRYASEAVLSSEYEDNYFDIRREVEQQEAAYKAERDAAVAASAADALQTIPTSTASSPGAPQLGPTQATVTPPRGQATAGSPAAVPAVKPKSPQKPIRKPSSEIEAERAAARFEDLSTMGSDVDELDTESLIRLLRNRLPFIHPVPLPPRAEQVPIPMPGLKAVVRYRAVAEYRLLYFLKNDVPWDLETFGYPEALIEHIRKVRGAQSAGILAKLARPNEKLAESEKIAEFIFPKVDEMNERRFRLQMSLPQKDEAFLTYRAAMALAAKPRPQVGGLNQPLVDVLKQFQKLSIDERRAFVKYVARPSARPSFSLLKQLAVGGAVLDPFPETGELRLALATGLERNATTPCSVGVAAACAQITKFIKTNAERKQLADLITNAESSGVSVVPLFSSGTFSFIKMMEPLGDPNDLLDIIGDPVTLSLQQQLIPRETQSPWLPVMFTAFLNLTPENREELLHHAAIMIYRASGTYSLPPVRLLALLTDSLSHSLAIICLTLMMLPATFIAIVFGGFTATKLVDRDRTRSLIAAEMQSGDVAGDIGLPVDLLGREMLVERIRKLGGRGWSTIALVGRRGIGKSRVLHELYKPAHPTDDGAAVSVWISAPTSYEEGEFVESVFERLAMRTEQAVADELGAAALSVRQLENGEARRGWWMFGTAVGALALLLNIAYDTLQRAEVMITWMPILVVVALATAAFIRYQSAVQPVDLSPWLERDRSRSASSVLLYRDARAALRYLGSRRARMEAGLSPTIRLGLAAGVGLILGAVIYWTIILGLDTTTFNVTIACVLAIGVVMLSIFAVYRITSKRETDPTGASIMSLTSNYRHFAATVVHHVDAGALRGRRGVMVCIDELDKVIEEASVRDFLRKMKGIFEVPGVYYYISMAEDTLARLNLASAEGKNEVDSALDHIVRVPPLSWKDSRELVQAYFAKRGFSGADERVATMIAAVSFGVPRDVIRRCDEMLAGYVGKPGSAVTIENVSAIAASVRRDRVELACEREGWNLEKQDRLVAAPQEAAETILAMLSGEKDERILRLLAMLWILCACEVTSGRSGKHAADEWERLYRLGYDLPTQPIEDIRSAIAVVVQSQKMVEDVMVPPSAAPLTKPPHVLSLKRKMLAATRRAGGTRRVVPEP